MQQHSARVVWPSLAGVMIAVLGVGPTLLAGALCSVTAIGFLLLLRNLTEEPRKELRRSPVREFVEGVRYSFASPILKMVMLLNFAVAFFGLAYLNMGPGFAREVLNFGASTTGFFVMAGGVGSIIGSVGLVFYDVRDKNTFVNLGLAGFGLSLVALCINPWAALSFVCMAAWGFSNSLFAVTAQTIFQTASDPRYLGRVIGLWSLGGGIGAITALPIGIAGDEIGLRWSLGVVCALLVLSTLYVMAFHLPAAQRETASLRRAGGRQEDAQPQPVATGSA
jgi:hypothetical protein